MISYFINTGVLIRRIKVLAVVFSNTPVLSFSGRVPLVPDPNQRGVPMKEGGAEFKQTPFPDMKSMSEEARAAMMKIEIRDCKIHNLPEFADASRRDTFWVIRLPRRKNVERDAARVFNKLWGKTARAIGAPQGIFGKTFKNKTGMGMGLWHVDTKEAMIALVSLINRHVLGGIKPQV